MTRYAMLDLGSGFIFSVCDAATPIDAANETDRDVGSDPQAYEDVSVSQISGRSGYAVYAVDDDFGCEDGQDQAVIDYVTNRAAPVAYLVRAPGRDDDDGFPTSIAGMFFPLC